ncbi:MAG TPA: NapC/NirT family cytochrome c [Acidobacteriota bacterium]|nr:NapC/NirT family cytochrome c [Acidobacteriota bacterium]HRR55751.1 NapC/NirT family cytochrome c [Acidobacteriota bacterium]
MKRIWGPFLHMLGANWLTLFGASIATISGVAIIGFFLLGFFGLADSPYIALMALLILPAFFVLGLLLIPFGLWREKRRTRRSAVQDVVESELAPYPVIDFNQPHTRHLAAVVSVLTVVNVLIISLASYEGVDYMDSTEFCGEVCHTVMEPEYTAYQGSPHSRVRCVECHIGPGAPWFVRSKLSGLGQVVAVTLNTYERPLRSPVENLRPSRDICETCHWPERFSGDRVRIITRYAEDEENTPLYTVLVMHIGGGRREEGIHSWHIRKGRTTYYIPADARRQNIPWVQVTEGDHTVEFVASDFEPGPGDSAAKREMDCIDCHNRPTHAFRLPGDAMDEAIRFGLIDRTIPYIKKVGTGILQEVGDVPGDVSEVTARLKEYYELNYPELWRQRGEELNNSFAAIAEIYLRNVFPEMSLTWGYHPNNIGHQDFPGCFRCHDGEHSSADDRVITQDCDLCHTILAMEEESPSVLQELGLE